MSMVEEKIVSFLKKQTGEIKAKKIYEAIMNDRITAGSVSGGLKRLVDQGMITKSRYGYYNAIQSDAESSETALVDELKQSISGLVEKANQVPYKDYAGLSTENKYAYDELISNLKRLIA